MRPATVSFKTVGCRLNQAETARFRAVFAAAGYQIVPFEAPAGVCVIHGCAVTAKAERDSARWARVARRTSPQAFVVLAGCAGEAGGFGIRSSSGADLVVGQADKFRLPELLAGHGFPPPSGREPGLPQFDTTRALVKVQDGCSFGCVYCIVPTARGASRSRPATEVVAEASGLARQGFREIVLTGANLGCYDDGGRRLVDLLAAVEAVPEIGRIRISSIELSTVEREVLDYMARSRKLCRFLHLPLQSGDDGILRAMGRRYAVADYRAAVTYAVDRVGLLGLGTDILVGFPGEDEVAFENTVRLAESLPFSNLHVFPYSPRPGTRAAELPAQVPATVAKERVRRLLAVGQAKRESFARGCLGRTVSVLVESLGPDGVGTGWTGEYLEARVRGNGVAFGALVEGGVEAVERDVLVMVR